MNKLTFAFGCFCSLNISANALTLKEKTDILIATYPSALSHQSGGYLHTLSGKKWLIDDGRIKSHQQALNSPDIEDSLRQVYPLLTCETDRKKDFDPGRIRFEDLLKELYGADKTQVQSRLSAVPWYTKKLYVNERQQAAVALAKVQRELAKDTRLTRYLNPSAGVFNWRYISGTKRLSVHSFAAAIDLNVRYADYWKWQKNSKVAGARLSFENKYPQKIVQVFEAHGFIWGGAWYHFDSMHFEYRPALIAIARAQGCSVVTK